MVRLTTCGDGFEARVLAARLGSEGIVWSLRGGHDGPLAIGTVDVLVDADDLATARDLLADDDLELAPLDTEPEPETTGRDVWFVALVFLVLVLFGLARMFAYS
jgi:hypothetical protein